ncbi:hypothetical protein K1719_044503 [Acacia pycnantha]|nr:hypothetical protein K1719_044503 [Acacia pycnantha]
MSGETPMDSSSSSRPVVTDHQQQQKAASSVVAATPLSRYESQKQRDWNTFGQYLKNQSPPVLLSQCKSQSASALNP